jgi:hypothetical protein
MSTVQLAPLALQQFNQNGSPVAGGQLFTYAAGTTNPIATYTDSTGLVANANPIILDANGQASIWLLPSVAYKFVLSPATDTNPPTNPYWTVNNITSNSGPAVGNETDEKGSGGQVGFVAGVDFVAGPGPTSVTLSQNYGSAGNLWVQFDAASQGGDTFTLGGANNETLTFPAGIPVGTQKLYVKGGTVLTIGAPGAGTVTDSSVSSSSRLYNRIFDIYDVKDYGAVGNRSTDDSAAFRAMFAAIPAYGKANIFATAANSYVVSQDVANPYCIPITEPVNIYADGAFGSIFPVAGTIVSTIQYNPDPNNPDICTEWNGLALGDPDTGTRHGLNGIYINTSAVGCTVKKKVFSRMNIMGADQAGGAAFLHINNPANNVNGAMFGSAIEHSTLIGGVNLQSSGDSNTIHKNVISGANTGIYASLTAGASLLTMENNNITNTGGALQIDSGSRFKFLRNNCEQSGAFTGAQQYAVDIRGQNGTMSTGEIRGNLISIFSGVSNAGVVHLNNCIGVHVEDNVILNANAGSAGIVVDTTAVNTRIGPNTYGSSVAAPVIDNGIGTMGVIKSITTFANAWANSPTAPTSTGRFMKDANGVVHLAGTLANGTTTPGTLMFTLPAGFQPDQQVKLPALTRGGGSIVAGEVWIDTAGNVTIQAGQNQYLSLDGMTFLAAGLANSTSNL